MFKGWLDARVREREERDRKEKERLERERLARERQIAERQERLQRELEEQHRRQQLEQQQAVVEEETRRLHALQLQQAQQSQPQPPQSADISTNELSVPLDSTGRFSREKLLSPKYVATFKAMCAKDPKAMLDIGSGDDMTVRVLKASPQPMQILWQFSTEAHDIGFSVAFEQTNSSGAAVGELPILPQKRCEAHSEVITGQHVAHSETGAWLLRFDNTYSYIRSKLVYFRVMFQPVENATGVPAQVAGAAHAGSTAAAGAGAASHQS